MQSASRSLGFFPVNPGLKLVVLALSLLATSFMLMGALFAIPSTNFNGEPNSLLSRLVAGAIVMIALGQLMATMVSFGENRQKLFKITSIILAFEVVGLIFLLLLN